MILFSFKHSAEQSPRFDELGRREWRWTLEAERWSIGLYESVRFVDGGNTWRPFNWYQACITKHAAWGTEHDFYDGPIHSFSVGRLHFNWRPWGCKGCVSE